MATITITVNIDELGLMKDEETAELYPGGDMMRHLEDRIMTQLTAKVRGIDKIQEQLANQINAAVQTIVVPHIENILTDQIQPTDYYGNPKGEPITIRGLVMAQVDRWAAPGDSRSGYSGNNRGNMGELVTTLVNEYAKKELKPIIEAAAKGIDQEVFKVAVEAAAAALKSKATRGY